MIPANISAQLLASAAPVYLSGQGYSNITDSAFHQVKTGFGVAGGLNVNTAGTSSAAALYDGTSSVVTATIAAPGVITWTGHPFVAGGAIKFSTTGALPTGITAGTTYYVSSSGLTADAFKLSDTAAHAIAGTNSITTTGTQSGVHTGWDVSRPMGTFSTTAQASLPLGQAGGQQFTQGLIVRTTDGGGAADVTVSYI